MVYTSISLTFVSLCFSVTAILVTWQKRNEHPAVAPLRTEIDGLRLGLSDVIDRVEHWQRRDRTRKARADAAGEQEPQPELAQLLSQHDVKAQLRAVARQKGVVR